MPIVVIGNNSGDDYLGFEDSQIKTYPDYLDYNFGGSAIMEISKYGSGDHTHGLCRASGLLSISGPVTVSEAYLCIYQSTGNTTNQTISLRHVLFNWIEGTQSGDNRSNDSPYSVCGNEYGDGNEWDSICGLTNGVDRSADVDGTIVTGTSTGYQQSSDMSAIAEDWINSIINNYGIHLERTDAENDLTYKVYSSSEGTDGQRPYLTVTYTEGGGASVVPAIMMAMNQFNGGMS